MTRVFCGPKPNMMVCSLMKNEKHSLPVNGEYYEKKTGFVR